MNVVQMRRISRSDPTPERLLRAEGYWEEGDAREVRVLTMMDHALGRLHLNGKISKRLYEAGEKFHKDWYYSGMADINGGMPRNEAEHSHRLDYRAAVQRIGMVRSRVVEMVSCLGLPLEHVELAWPQASKQLSTGLENLADFWGL